MVPNPLLLGGTISLRFGGTDAPAAPSLPDTNDGKYQSGAHGCAYADHKVAEAGVENLSMSVQQAGKARPPAAAFADVERNAGLMQGSQGLMLAPRRQKQNKKVGVLLHATPPVLWMVFASVDMSLCDLLDWLYQCQGSSYLQTS